MGVEEEEEEGEEVEEVEEEASLLPNHRENMPDCFHPQVFELLLLQLGH